MPDIPDRNEITRRVIESLAKTQHLQTEQIRAESTFDELKIDSLDGINIVFGIESEFDVNVPDEDLKKLASVKDIIDGVELLLKAKAGA